MKHYIQIFSVFLLVSCVSLVSFASETQTFRNAKGMKEFTATTSGNTTTYRDSKGMLVMTAVESNGAITYRDAKGRLIGRSVRNTSRQDAKKKSHIESVRKNSSTANDSNEGPTDDYQLLRDVMEQRAICRNSMPTESPTVEKAEATTEGAEKIVITEENKPLSPGGVVHSIVGVAVALPMMVIVGAMAVWDVIMG